MGMKTKMGKLELIISYVYITFLFSIYPLLTKGSYYGLGDMKYLWLKWTTISLFIVLAMVFLFEVMVWPREQKKGISGLDIAVAMYGVFAIVSACQSRYKDQVWAGADGWYMGLLSQLLFVGIYFCISRAAYMWDENAKYPVMAIAIGSSVVMLIGIVQSFGIDFAGWYGDDYADLNGVFFTTMGQSSWYGSYVVLINALAAFLLYDSIVKLRANSNDKAKNNRIMLALAVVYEIIAAVAAISLKAQAVMLSLAAIVVICICYYIYQSGKCEKIWLYALIAVLVLGLAYVIAGICNTKGVFGETYRGLSGILCFDGYWGNQRGIIWKQTFMGWLKMGLREKMFGLGPDCFEQVIYYADVSEINQYMANAYIMCAHNEWLNSIICYGLFGGLAYLAIFIVALIRCIKSLSGEAGYFLGMLAIIIYIVYGTFCYQQYYSTPMIFAVLAVAEANQKKTFYQNNKK